MTPFERIAELEAEVVQLRHDLGEMIDLDRVASLARILKIRPGCARLLLALYNVSPRTLSKHSLEETIKPDHAFEYSDGSKIIDVYVCEARKTLPPQAISTVRTCGYALTAIGFEAVQRVLEPSRVAA